MIEVKVSRITTKKKKKLYTVAIIVRSNGKKMLSYQGRYKRKADAMKKKRELEAQLNRGRD